MPRGRTLATESLDLVPVTVGMPDFSSAAFDDLLTSDFLARHVVVLYEEKGRVRLYSKNYFSIARLLHSQTLLRRADRLE